MFYNNLKKKCANKTHILVDFFDTVMFREVHSFQLMAQWENALKIKFPELIDLNLSLIRKNIIKDLGKEECVIPYKELLKNVFDQIKTSSSFSFDEFYNTSFQIDKYIDMATQYPNKKIVNALKKLRKDGKSIILVTDYYLPAEVYNDYLSFFNLRSLFDEIVCSSDLQLTKSSGELYEYVITQFGSPKNMIMIGDSKESDYINALKHGIDSIRYFPFFHKVKTNIRLRNGYSFDKHAAKSIYKKCYSDTLFAEYGINLSFFSRNLYKEAKLDNAKSLAFLSRGGYLLKICFEQYQNLAVPEDSKINAIYIKNSRRVNRDAEKYPECADLLRRYFEQNGVSNPAYVVDEGWYCTSQIAFHKLFGWDVYGYYVGVMENKPIEGICKRRGILFEKNENGKPSSLYGVFRTNCTFYEELLGAPHGSAKKYVDQNGRVEVEEKWEDIEREFYYKRIKELQKKAMDVNGSLICWNIDLSKYELSKYVIHTLLYSSQERIAILKEFNDSWFDNVNDTQEKSFGDIYKLRINVLDLIVHPENYLRYFCKVKELQLNHKSFRVFYPIVGRLIDWYCSLFIMMRYRHD